jgi:hypothetical protein
MKIEELVPLTNGLSVHDGPRTMVCDRARITRIGDDAVDMSFLIAGTDIVPRLRLRKDRIDRGTPEDLARVVQNVARRALAHVE